MWTFDIYILFDSVQVLELNIQKIVEAIKYIHLVFLSIPFRKESYFVTLLESSWMTVKKLRILSKGKLTLYEL